MLSLINSDGGAYYIETSPLLCRSNQWTGFYMIGTSYGFYMIRASNLFLMEFILIWSIITLKGAIVLDSRSLKPHLNSCSLITEPKEAFVFLSFRIKCGMDFQRII